MSTARNLAFAVAMTLALVGAVLITMIRPVIGLGAIAAVALTLILRNRPKPALVIWLLTIAFVPPWVGADVAGFIPAASLLGVVVLLASLGRASWSPHAGDLVLLLMIVFGAVGVYFAGASAPIWASMLTMWGIAYLVGKVLTGSTGMLFVSQAIVAVMTITAAMSVLEFALSWHPFVDLAFDNLLYSTWASIQERGGVFRSEWAFGHSIALGGSLALAVPFAFAIPMRMGRRVLIITILGAGTVLTFSRSSMFAFILSLVLALVFRSALTAVQKVGVVLLGGLGVVAVLPFVSGVFDEAGTEAQWSGSYRGSLLELIPYLIPIGRSPIAQFGQDGSVMYGRYASIDNAFLALALSSGWLIAAFALAPFVVMIFRALRRRASAAEIALIGQLPLLFTVATITQWQMLLWFVAGVAVGAARLNRTTDQVSSSAPAKSARLGEHLVGGH